MKFRTANTEIDIQFVRFEEELRYRPQPASFLAKRRPGKPVTTVPEVAFLASKRTEIDHDLSLNGATGRANTMLRAVLVITVT